MSTFRHFVPLAAAAMLLAACGSRPEAPVLAVPIGKPVTIRAPRGLPAVPIPADNPPTAETIRLGSELYFNTALSADGTISCATCHHPGKGFTDNQRFSTGVGGKQGGRNAPTVLNAAYNRLQFWDGRAASLELQAGGPMMNPVEMAHTPDALLKRCTEDSEIRKMVEAAYGPGPVTLEKLTHAIASFERTLVSGNSPFDRFFYGGEKTALSESAQRGLVIFRSPLKGNCGSCHLIDEKWALFTDNQFHNLGVGLNPDGELTDMGRYEQTKVEADRGAFRTPTLRNIALTAPYMHDGSLKTLKEVVDFYVGGGSSNPHLDKEIKPLKTLSGQDRQDLVAFLESLNGETHR